MAITSPPTPPNTGNPAQLEERADAFFGWFPSFVSDFNDELPLLRGKTWAARGGSANAITLTAGVVSLAEGTQVRFRAVAPNTGAVTINLDGLGVVACRTITGAVLPAGYIRTDTETVATYDGTFWVLDRAAERGSNANGSYIRLASGLQICASPDFTFNLTTPTGAGYAAAGQVWNYPATFVYVSSESGVCTNTTATWVVCSPRSASSVIVAYSFGAPTGQIVRATSIGYWY